MRKNRWKRGSYLVEAALTIPIFIISVFMLISVIPVYSAVENVIFSTTSNISVSYDVSFTESVTTILNLIFSTTSISFFLNKFSSSSFSIFTIST